jgi:hypothetical protein
MFQACTSCGFDWERNELGLSVELNGKRLPDDGSKMPLHCPVCGAPGGRSMSLDLLGAVKLKDRIIRWEDAAKGPVSISGAEVVGPKSVMFDNVPVFADGRGEPQCGPLPVRPEYVDLVDLPRFLRDFEVCRGRLDLHKGTYEARVPFRGLRNDEPDGLPQRRELPLWGKDGARTSRPREDAIPGMELTLWPNIRTRLWRRFIVEARAFDRVHEMTRGGPLRIVVGPRNPNEMPFDLAAIDSFTIPNAAGAEGTSTQARARMIRHCGLCDGRPRWLSVSVKDPTGRTWGCTYLPEPEYDAGRGDASIHVGVDFGTSNSCVAFATTGRKGRVHPLRDLNAYLIRAIREGQPGSGGAYTPRMTARGFGPDGEFLPTQIMSRWQPAHVLALSEPEIDELRPGLDVAIPGNDVDWAGWNAEATTIGGLKWKDDATVSNAAVQPRRRPIISTFFKCLFIQTLAHEIADLEREAGGQMSAVPAVGNLSWSTPGSWSIPDNNELRAAIEGALRRGPHDPESGQKLQDWVNLVFEIDREPTTEAFAAGRMALSADARAPGQTSSGIHLLVDIGGGSTDVAFCWARESMDGTQYTRQYMTSLRYAGEDIFDALLGPNRGADAGLRCFAASQTPAEITRAMRRNGFTSDLVPPVKTDAAKKRVNVFFEQLLEYLARMVVASILSGQARRQFPHAEELHVHLVRLGNGWGLASLEMGDIDSVFAYRLQQRVQRILTDAGDRSFTVVATPRVLPHDVHPKSALALGLLESNSAFDRAQIISSLPRAAGRSWSYRSFVGLPTLGRREQVPKSDPTYAHRIEWFWPVESDDTYNPEWHGKTPLHSDAVYFWQHFASSHPQTNEGWAETAPAPLLFPETITGSRENSRADFDKACHTAEPDMRRSLTPRGWFARSPLEHLIERGLRDRLKTLI